MWWAKTALSGVKPITMLGALCFLILTYYQFRAMAQSYEGHCEDQTKAFNAQTERDKKQDESQLAMRDKQYERDRVQDAEFQMIHPILVELKTNTENMKTDISDIKKMLEEHVIP